MDIGQVEFDKTLDKRDRNSRIEIDCDVNRQGNYKITAHREIVFIDEDSEGEKKFKTGLEDFYLVMRDLVDISTDEVVLPAEYGGITLNVAQVAKALEMLTDAYAEQDRGSEFGT
jgi:hypothetical protein